jgi:serine/threonine protein kinase
MAHDNKYQKQRLIGSGERVDVYLGLNVAFGRKVAIKELRGGVETSATERNGFFAEYEKWAKLEHARIARIEDIDKTRAWVIQEYLPQSILDLASGFISNPTAAYTALEQILEGLAYLHQAGLIHFNLKSSNVRAANETIKLCDGRCVPIGFPGSLPKPRGSNRYLAPEMINEEFGHVGTATDIYVAGMIMLESLAGPQFESLFKGYVLGTPDTEIGWVRWHNSPETLDPIHKTLPHVPSALATLVEGMICKQVTVRYASADRLLSDLRSLREAIVSAVPAVSSVPRTDVVHPSPASPTSTAPRPPAGSAHDVSDGQVKLIDRPISPTYVRCLSGALAGSLFPTTMGEILIGEGNHCSVRISADHCPLIAGREVKIFLGSNGWQISDSLNHPIIIDSKTSFETAALRSGSIFRLSPKGPDFQFVVQGQHDNTWQDIAADLDLFDSQAKVPNRFSKQGKSIPPRPEATQTSALAQSAVAAPSRPKPATPTKPAAPVKPQVAAPAPPRPHAPTAPGAPVRPASTAPLAESIPKQPMDKNKRNNLILFISLPIVAILIILFMPRSEPAQTKEKNKTEEVVPNSVDSEKKESADEKSDSTNDDKAIGQLESTESDSAKARETKSAQEEKVDGKDSEDQDNSD